MNLISYRPRYWNAVVGQDRVLRLITAILTTARFIPRGFIFCGPYGLGKTSTAYLTARALLCQGDDRLGCGKCPSCLMIDAPNLEEGLEQHPDFKRVVAAEHPGVEYSRTIRDLSEAVPVLSRRVILIDEAHRLSSDAWDVYLTPLEKGNTDSIFLFVTSEESKIPQTISSRCCHIRFHKVPEDTIFGLLAITAARENITYEISALREIARRSDNSPRNALKYLGQVASLGNVTRELIDAVVEAPLNIQCRDLYSDILKKDQKAAVTRAEELALIATPSQVIEKMFTMYGEAILSPQDDLDKAIRTRYADIAGTTTFFLKWQGSFPAAALSLFAYEFMYLKESRPPLPIRIERKVEVPVVDNDEPVDIEELLG